MPDSYDVVIAGGGLAGLTLARQFARTLPDLKVAVVEPQERPLQEAAHKVGESSVEGGTSYFNRTLGLAEYTRTRHLPKLAFRFWGGGGSTAPRERMEWGAPDFPAVPSVQLDRGRFENDLRAMCVEDGTTLLEGFKVSKLELHDDRVHDIEIIGQGETRQLQADWFVDATGWRRLLASKLDLTLPSPHRASSSWWRVRGKYDTSDMEDADVPGWMQRSRAPRWFATNHFMGHGYWVWVIPLSSNMTSIGIVSDETIHPIKNRASLETSLEWLRQHEPELARFVENAEVEDFLALKNYAHTTKMAFSSSRWALVGPAAAFTDPLYSVGSDLIGWANTMVVDLVRNHRKNVDIRAKVDEYNTAYLALVDHITRMYAGTFTVFQNDRVSLLKIVWDAAVYFSLTARVLLQEIIAVPGVLTEHQRISSEIYKLHPIIENLLIEWSNRKGREALPAGFYFPGVTIEALRPAFLGPPDLMPQEPAAFLEDTRRRCALIHDLAQVIFTLAVEDICPSALDELRGKGLSLTALSLDPERWQRDGLFDPEREPRDVTVLMQQVRRHLADPEDPARPNAPRPSAYFRGEQPSVMESSAAEMSV